MSESVHPPECCAHPGIPYRKHSARGVVVTTHQLIVCSALSYFSLYKIAWTLDFRSCCLLIVIVGVVMNLLADQMWQTYCDDSRYQLRNPFYLPKNPYHHHLFSNFVVVVVIIRS